MFMIRDLTEYQKDISTVVNGILGSYPSIEGNRNRGKMLSLAKTRTEVVKETVDLEKV